LKRLQESRLELKKAFENIKLLEKEEPFFYIIKKQKQIEVEQE